MQSCRNFRLSQRANSRKVIIRQEGTGKAMSYFNKIYGDPELSSKAKLVLLYLHDRANQKGKSWYAIDTMARDLSLSKSTVKRALVELMCQGHVEKIPRFRKNGGRTSNCYRCL